MDEVHNLRNELRLSWDLPGDGGMVALAVNTQGPMTSALMGDLSSIIYSVEHTLERMAKKAEPREVPSDV